MKFMYNKSKFTIVFLLIFSLLIQIAGPIAENYVYAKDVVEEDIGQKDSSVDIELPEEGEEPDEESENQSKPDESVEAEYQEENQGKNDNVESRQTDEEEQENQEEQDKDSDNKEDIQNPVDKEEVEETEDENNQESTDEEEPEPEEKQPIEDEEEPFIGPMIEEEIKLYSAPNDLDNIFTSVKLTVNGEEVKDGEIIPEIKDGTKVELSYKWNTVGKDVASGDTVEIQIPDIFTVDNFNDKDLLLSDKTTVAGKWSTDNGKLSIVFNENGKDVANGYLNFGLSFNMEKFKEDVIQKIEFNTTEDKTLTIVAKPETTVAGIFKKGEPDSTEDAKEINWTVEILNLEDTPLTNATLEDLLPDGLKLGDIKVYDLSLGLEGRKTKGSEVNIIPKVKTDSGFKFEFDSIDSYSGYQIEYNTEITDFSKTEFTNKVYFNKNAEGEPDAEATVSGLKRSNLIEKDGSYLGKDEDRIEWFIDVNKPLVGINNAVIIEELPPGLELVEDTLKVYDLIKTGDKWGENGIASDKTIVESDFPTINLGEVEQDRAYRIKFKTSIDYSKVNGGIYKGIDNEFLNKVTLKDGESKLGDAEKTVSGIDRHPIIEKTEISNISYTDKTLTWQLEINKAKHLMNGVKIVDTLPAGLKIEVGNIKVLDSDDNSSNILDGNITIEPDTEDSTKTKVTMNLGDIGRNHYKIQYTVDITDFGKANFPNEAYISGEGIGTSWNYDTNTISVGGNEYKKESTSIDYNNKTISWKLTVDPKREPIKKLEIIDTFPKKGLILIEKTLVVKQGEGEQPLIRDDGSNNGDYILKPYTDPEDKVEGYQRGFTLEFPKITKDNPLSEEVITVEYETSFDPDAGIEPNGNTDNKLYSNEAKFIWETDTRKGDKIVPVDKEVRDSSWNSGKKEGRLINVDDEGNRVGEDGKWISGYIRKLEWEVYINYLEQSLGAGVSVEDTLGYEGKIDEDSIQVKTYTVDANGNTSYENGDTSYEDGTTLDKDKYDVEIDADRECFTLNFKEEVNERYVIIYTTSVPNISSETYTNTATTTGEKVGDKGHTYTGTVSFDQWNDNLSKEALGLDGNSKVYTDDELKWEVLINESMSIIENVVITDTISDGLVYLKDTMEIYRLEKGSEFKLTEGTDYKLSVDTTTSAPKTELKIEFNSPIDSTHLIKYTTVVTEENGIVNNTVAFSGDNITVDSVETEKLQATQFSSTGGDPAKGKIKIIKQDENGVKITSSEATFALWYELNGEYQKFQNKNFETTDGEVEIGNLALGKTYYLEEIKAPEGYLKSNERFKIKVETAFGNEVSNIEKISVINVEKIQVTGKKIWINGPEVKPDIKLQLYRYGVAYGESVTLEDGKTEYTWTDLAKTNTDGEEYIYTIGEEEVEKDSLKNYGKSYSDDKLTITNTYNSPKTDVVGRKIWENGPTPRPNIELQLYRDGVAYGESVTLKNGETEYIWKDLDRTDKNAKNYTYTVKEVNIPENYKKSEEGLTVTNTYVIPKTEVTGIKKWVNGSTPRPNIELQLYRDDKAYGEPIKLEDGETIYTWTNLDKTDINGKVYIYTVDEVRVPYRYDKEISADGLTITNIYNPPSDSGGSDPGPDNKTGRIKILKKAYDTNALLEGAEFDIINSKGKVVDTLTTDRKGRAVSKDLPLGDYKIEEVKAPEGYILNDRVIKKTVTYGVSQEVVVYNELDDPDNPTNPDPKDPTDPEEPVDPEDLEITEKPEDPKDPDEEVDINGNTPEGRPDIDTDKDSSEDPSEEIDVDGNLPKDRPSLPTTGSKDNIVFYVIGLASILIGFALRKKTKQNG